MEARGQEGLDPCQGQLLVVVARVLAIGSQCWWWTRAEAFRGCLSLTQNNGGVAGSHLVSCSSQEPPAPGTDTRRPRPRPEPSPPAPKYEGVIILVTHLEGPSSVWPATPALVVISLPGALRVPDDCGVTLNGEARRLHLRVCAGPEGQCGEQEQTGHAGCGTCVLLTAHLSCCLLSDCVP